MTWVDDLEDDLRKTEKCLRGLMRTVQYVEGGQGIVWNVVPLSKEGSKIC